MPKIKEKETAIKLRKKGFSYSEILEEIPVAKSTLSLWLRDVGLAKKQKQRLTEKRIAAALRGAKAKKDQRLAITKEIKDKARNEVGKLSYRELWLIGVALYWAEGTKEKEYRRGEKVTFFNSDPEMVLLFSKWLKVICLVKPQDLTYDLYIHETANWKKAQLFWSRILSISSQKIKIYFKKHKINTKRRNTGSDYHGLLRIKVKRSINLNRKIAGWIEGIYKQCGVV